MTVLPVIARELRVQARLGFTYTMRVIGAGALLGVCLYFGAKVGFSPQLGGWLFGWLNCALVAAIWILVPLISADCISRERREGTVGLLFLTPLKAREIVWAKGMVHGVRALTLWFAVLPIMTISFLVGGVTWKEALLSALMTFNSICWALAAGVLASSASKPWLRAMLLAGGIAGCFAVALDFLIGAGILWSIGSDGAFHLPYPYTGFNWHLQANPVQAMLASGFFGVTGMEGWWGTMFGTLKRVTQRNWLLTEGLTALTSLFVLVAAGMVAAWNLRRTWQEEPPSARLVWLEQKLCTPVIGVAYFKRWIRKKLEHNPIGWLEQRTWSGRLVTWGWFAVMVSFYSAIFQAPNSGILTAVQNMMAWMLLGIVAVTASGSFQRERETRVLEVLLVSPMSAAQIISGRLRGLWGQFLPSLVLLVSVWIYLAGTVWSKGDFSKIPFFCGGFLTLPVIGLYYSLKRKHFLGAFLSTLLAGILLPFVLQWVTALIVELCLKIPFITYFWDPGAPGIETSTLVILVNLLQQTVASPLFVVLMQLLVALRVGRKLHRAMVRRDFSYTSAVT